MVIPKIKVCRDMQELFRNMKSLSSLRGHHIDLSDPTVSLAYIVYSLWSLILNFHFLPKLNL